MKLNMDRVLVLSPHTDDMELGAGSTVRKLVESGITVKSLVFSDCKESVDRSKHDEDVLIKECKAAAQHLGINDLTILEYPVRRFPDYRQDILERIYLERKEFRPDLVITPSINDLHQDHKTIGEETRRAFMRTGTSIWMYQVPGTVPGFTPSVFIKFDEEDVSKKIEMLHKYESQVIRRDYFEPDKIRAFLNYGGTFIGTEYAEAFEIEKLVFSDFVHS